MKINQRILLLVCLWLGNYVPILGQLKSIISVENRYLIAKINNPIRIVAQQDKPVSIDQLKATFQKDNSEKQPIAILEGDGYFIINPDKIGIEKHTSKIIMKTKSGDIYIFRQIKYKCPAAEKFQRSEDMIFEIK